MKMKTIILTFVLIIRSLSKNAQAASPKLEGSFVDWNVFSIAAGNDKICWALSKPLSKSPKSVNHGDVYFMVSSWKSGSAKAVSYTHLRAHETPEHLVCRLLLEKKKTISPYVV